MSRRTRSPLGRTSRGRSFSGVLGVRIWVYCWAAVGVWLLVFICIRLRNNLLVHSALTGSETAAHIALRIGADPNARYSADELADLVEAVAGQRLHEVNRSPVLVTAVFSGHPAVVRLLIDAGADVNSRDRAGMTPLMAAAIVGDRQSVRRLLAAGADPNARWKDGSTVLMNAGRDGDQQIKILLRAAGAREERLP